VVVKPDGTVLLKLKPCFNSARPKVPAKLSMEYTVTGSVTEAHDTGPLIIWEENDQIKGS
jgi:hypothetical protein